MMVGTFAISNGRGRNPTARSQSSFDDSSDDDRKLTAADPSPNARAGVSPRTHGRATETPGFANRRWPGAGARAHISGAHAARANAALR